MKHIFTLMFLLLMPGVLRAEQTSLAPRPIPAPTTPRIAMEVEQNESFSSDSAKDELKDLAAELKQDEDVKAFIISNEKSARSIEAWRIAKQIKNYLVKKEQIKSDRIIIVRGSSKTFWKVRIYLVPSAKRIEDGIEQPGASLFLNYGIRGKGNIQRVLL